MEGTIYLLSDQFYDSIVSVYRKYCQKYNSTKGFALFLSFLENLNLEYPDLYQKFLGLVVVDCFELYHNCFYLEEDMQTLIRLIRDNYDLDGFLIDVSLEESPDLLDRMICASLQKCSLPFEEQAKLRSSTYLRYGDLLYQNYHPFYVEEEVLFNFELQEQLPGKNLQEKIYQNYQCLIKRFDCEESLHCLAENFHFGYGYDFDEVCLFLDLYIPEFCTNKMIERFDNRNHLSKEDQALLQLIVESSKWQELYGKILSHSSFLYTILDFAIQQMQLKDRNVVYNHPEYQRVKQYVNKLRQKLWQ